MPSGHDKIWRLPYHDFLQEPPLADPNSADSNTGLTYRDAGAMGLGYGTAEQVVLGQQAAFQ